MTKRPVALITGASSGIGAHFAAQLAASGHDFVLVARRRDKLEAVAAQVASQSGAAAEILVADLGTNDGMDAVAHRIESGGQLALVINNAGYAVRGDISALDPVAMAAMLQVNVVALTRLSTSAAKRMKTDGAGAIINVASGTVFMQMPGNALYGASKNYVLAFTRHLRAECAAYGVKVQLLVPGLIDTPFHDVVGNDISRLPQHIVMQAEDLVAASLRGLALDEAVCIPSLPDIADWDAYVAAEQKVAGNVSRDRVAQRYT